MSFAQKENYYFYIYDVITWGKKEKKRCYYTTAECPPHP